MTGINDKQKTLKAMENALVKMEERFLDIDRLEWAVAEYKNSSVFCCPYNLNYVKDWWIKWDTLYVIKEEGDKAIEYNGQQYDNDYKRPDDYQTEDCEEHSHMLIYGKNRLEKKDYYEIRLKEVQEEIAEEDEEDEELVKKVATLTEIIKLLETIISL
tara:strand:- start:13978 stop:14451 length:474 start_codon:yes stop_codon:yes gene_type:complete